jgi:hypothetical protein
MLLTNGCSFVWGDELEGYDNDPPTHWGHTFTHKLSELLGIPYVNIATCGACNQKIFRDTTDYLRKCDQLPTHIVILWSAFQREEVAENHPEGYELFRNIKRYQCMTQISPSRLNNVKPELEQLLDQYYDYYDVTRTGIIRTINYMTHMQWLCESLGIKLIQGVFHARMWETISQCMHPKYRTTRSPWTEWMDYVGESIGELKDTSRVGMGRYVDFYSVALKEYTIKPHQHPDEDAHTAYADLLAHIFETQFGDDK